MSTCKIGNIYSEGSVWRYPGFQPSSPEAAPAPPAFLSPPSPHGSGHHGGARAVDKQCSVHVTFVQTGLAEYTRNLTPSCGIPRRMQLWGPPRMQLWGPSKKAAVVNRKNAALVNPKNAAMLALPRKWTLCTGVSCAHS
ncbi:hypothetical protein NDU88_007408 [Pleurodeles waltl]|uniref:Uncharacterized protein n=1 Tax=Pleurodeles waltl TaxID=8319 RepID=A0AAV7WJ56_PLEWA|nr:hypothetical protein NDU88_007408 [Pleurodeles waltl]